MWAIFWTRPTSYNPHHKIMWEAQFVHFVEEIQGQHCKKLTQCHPAQQSQDLNPGLSDCKATRLFCIRDIWSDTPLYTLPSLWGWAQGWMSPMDSRPQRLGLGCWGTLELTQEWAKSWNAWGHLAFLLNIRWRAFPFAVGILMLLCLLSGWPVVSGICHLLCLMLAKLTHKS